MVSCRINIYILDYTIIHCLCFLREVLDTTLEFPVILSFFMA